LIPRRTSREAAQATKRNLKERRVGALDDAPLVEAEDREAWRRWLQANHQSATGAWLVNWRRSSGRDSVDYVEAVEEALCFGWVDGQAAPVDDHCSKQYFAPRKPRSPWAKSNRERVERLSAEGRMAPAGMAVVERARADGSWAIFESVDRLEVPADLADALAARPPARETWDGYPRSVRHAALSWVVLARRPETRASRITVIAEAAERGDRPLGPPGTRARDDVRP
jgi:uncharacterized protein YdeI (YjbR/CyaY-like superfamily)